MKTRATLGALLLCLALLAGCGSGEGGDSSGEGGTRAAEAPRVIVETAGAGFDAARVFREAAPGVVTIRSVFDAGAAEGSGFVLNAAGEIVTTGTLTRAFPVAPGEAWQTVLTSVPLAGIAIQFA